MTLLLRFIVFSTKNTFEEDLCFFFFLCMTEQYYHYWKTKRTTSNIWNEQSEQQNYKILYINSWTMLKNLESKTTMHAHKIGIRNTLKVIQKIKHQNILYLNFYSLKWRHKQWRHNISTYKRQNVWWFNE